MPDVSAKPVIFISYSHKDEPEKPREGEIPWLSLVRTYLQPAIKDGIFDLWVDLHLTGGVDFDPEIKRKLQACDIFILLVSANSMASNYIVDTEIATIRDRQAKGEDVHFYPLLLTPTPDAGLNKVKDKNLRPRDARPFSGFSYHGRLQHMTDAANEIGKIAQQIVERRGVRTSSIPEVSPAYVHISGLPETAYEKLRGRDDELKCLDDAWSDHGINILSLIAEGGAGKSALINEWLKRLRADSYRGAEMVLGWSFYSQGTKERTTSAEVFLNWAIEKLGIEMETTSATAKGEVIAEALTRRRVLLLLDGCEPLQHGLDKQQGELKDQGLRALLRRLAATPPDRAHGLIVLTSRLAIKDIARWKDSSAPVEPVDQLSDEAGASLLRDNGVWGLNKELQAASRDFGGHPLALGLLASFLKETQFGDVRRRDHIRQFFADPENPRHDHARRVMESYEKEWLAGQPILLAILHVIGLFDRPATNDCLQALRREPVISGLSEVLINLDEIKWQRSIDRLREVRLLAPVDLTVTDALDAHPLVREWFGERLKQVNEAAWMAGHGRLYEHLRDTTKEGKAPSLEDMAPLYQAIMHGCRAGRHVEALNDVYADRICMREADGRIRYYVRKQLGAMGVELVALSWFFDDSYDAPIAALPQPEQSWVLSEAAFNLRALGRFAEALPAERAGLRMDQQAKSWRNAAISAHNLCGAELLVGEIAAAETTARMCIAHADESDDGFTSLVGRVACGEVLNSAGRRGEAEHQFADAEQRQIKRQPKYPLLYSGGGFHYCDLLLDKGDYTAVRDRAMRTLEWGKEQYNLLDRALDRVTLGRAYLGLALNEIGLQVDSTSDDACAAGLWHEEAVDGLRVAGQSDHIPRGLLARSAFHCSIGDWEGAVRDLEEIEEIAEPGSMKLRLCDMALARARLAFAKMEAYAPLNGLTNNSPPKPAAPDAAKSEQLKKQAAKHLTIAAGYIQTCGYHRRDEELAELQAVLRGERKFADLPPRV